MFYFLQPKIYSCHTHTPFSPRFVHTLHFLFVTHLDAFFLEKQTLFPRQTESTLGQLDYTAVISGLQKNRSKKIYSKFTEDERFLIGKYAAINGASAAVRKFKTSHPHLKFGESTARSLRDKYHQLSKTNTNINKITPLRRGRPLMLGSLDE